MNKLDSVLFLYKSEEEILTTIKPFKLINIPKGESSFFNYLVFRGLNDSDNKFRFKVKHIYEDRSIDILLEKDDLSHLEIENAEFDINSEISNMLVIHIEEYLDTEVLSESKYFVKKSEVDINNIKAIKGYKRLNNIPLDADSLFSTEEELEAYLLNSKNIYEGQIVSIKDGVYVIYEHLGAWMYKKISQGAEDIIQSVNYIEGIKRGENDLGKNINLDSTILPVLLDKDIEFKGNVLITVPPQQLEDGLWFVENDNRYKILENGVWTNIPTIYEELMNISSIEIEGDDFIDVDRDNVIFKITHNDKTVDVKSGFVKIISSDKGHITETEDVNKEDLTDLIGVHTTTSEDDELALLTGKDYKFIKRLESMVGGDSDSKLAQTIVKRINGSDTLTLPVGSFVKEIYINIPLGSLLNNIIISNLDTSDIFEDISQKIPVYMEVQNIGIDSTGEIEITVEFI